MKKYALLILGFVCASCQSQEKSKATTSTSSTQNMENKNLQTATFAGGCFWCTEAVFLEIDGVQSVKPGYTGGKRVNPSYEDVCTGTTGHAEAIEIQFDPSKVSYPELLQVFFATHDPTTLNRQGADVGTQYRSEIFYHSPGQQKQAEEYLARLNAEHTFGGSPIVTTLSPAKTFYVAEDYHQNYYARNKNQSYCHFVITPKVEKVRKVFKNKLKH